MIAVRRIGLVIAFLALSPALRAGTLKVTAYDGKGRVLDREGLLRHIAPASRQQGQSPAQSGLFASDLEGRALGGAFWWDEQEQNPVWRWDGDGAARFSLPWPIQKDGFSTVTVDSRGTGYRGEQTILLNEEIAVSAYYRLQEAYKQRTSLWSPNYKPSARAKQLLDDAKEHLREATAEKIERKRAQRFDEALSEISFAWQQILFEHGRQVLEDEKRSSRMRWGVTLDERAVDRIKEYDWIAERLEKAGVNWVRLVFRAHREDFAFARPASFTLYDELVDALTRRRVRVMGSVLDSLLWPKGVTPEAFEARARNLALHYGEKVRSWEIASESNGSWIGGTSSPLPDETVLECVRRGARAVKAVDPALETVATLHWWEGTAPAGRGLFQWLRMARVKGFGDGFDVIGLSVYPDRHPLGIAFDPVFGELRRLFPESKLMLGGWAYEDDDRQTGYWWLEPGDVKNARKDLAILFTGAAAAIPESLGGGFFWQTLDHMLKPKKRTTSFYRVYRSALRRINGK
ncbi:MAG: hypothetical protein CO113_09785 [Elusimicrobia bacterium CG_4_9_14_3_um_filter_62_55]|nr:MAG: hypothetical protein COR54_16540 [Elusimicrobia bacterium CG22_combo_CG10-13_8_21_14_all_63_91]PJA12118.1 MAG: hypothetical protein COX66_18095 [Elusimicrobia bacterium CG_4_10_14_0_2_um_filter_63_34]PJB25210.1 MAG: hypothetical protein CO113_09785 [Elusimicrobia bacterium CG_4_9_14_3_um_filter_62_55]